MRTKALHIFFYIYFCIWQNSISAIQMARSVIDKIPISLLPTHTYANSIQIIHCVYIVSSAISIFNQTEL